MARKTFEMLSVSVRGLELEIRCQSIYSASKPLHGNQWRSEFLGFTKLKQLVENSNLFRKVSLIVKNIYMQKSAYRNFWNGTTKICSLWWEHPTLTPFIAFDLQVAR
jgi:hypothetical protein